MKRALLQWIVAAGCALGAAACAETGSKEPPEETGVARQAVSQDVTPPVLLCAQPGDCTLASSAVNVTAGPAQIGVTARFTDAPAGLQGAFVALTSPSGNQAVSASMSGAPVSGTPQDGVYQAAFTIPQFAESGDWHVTSIYAVDEANNTSVYFGANLAASGFPLLLTVVSNPDTTPPALVCGQQPGDCALASSTVDVTAGPAQLGMTVHFSDAPAGLQGAFVALTSPSGNQGVSASMSGAPANGTPQDGVYQAAFSIPQFAESGDWHVTSIYATDEANNTSVYFGATLAASGFPLLLTVVSNPDTTPPVLTCGQPGDCVLSSPAVDTATGSVQVDVTAHFVDAPAGLQGAFVAFTSPSGNQGVSASMGGVPASGTPQNGVYNGTATIPQFAEAGVWRATSIYATDAANNTSVYYGASLAATNFPSAIHVCHANDACNDADACTTGETCNGGYCNGGAQVSCDDANACTTDSCNPASGCAHAVISCDDGNPCTTDSCNPAYGCTYIPNSAACDDGDVCTTGDHCAAGTCEGNAVSCDDGNECTQDVCDPAAGCTHPEKKGPCDDGNPCTSTSKCSGGICKPGELTSCDDGEECTNDSCDPAVGCVFAPRTGSCGPAPGGCTSGGVCLAGHCTVGTVCGDGTCCSDGGENHCNCPADCDNPPGVPECGNGCCSADEDACSCPQDCQPVPNDNKCCGNEDACNSPADCGADTCGNGCCGANETTCSCPTDCGSACNDGCCSPGEDACGCPADCQPVPNDTLCCGNEDACNSPADCGADTCGNGCCGADETPCSCPADCGAVVCGDGVCAGCGEDECSCPGDCGGSGDACAKDCGSKCGDGCCGIGPDGLQETACTCELDCATTCGDGCCSGDEDSCSCPGDCGAPECGNGKCEACAGETPCGCASDCGSASDGQCCGGENGCNSQDCGPPALHNHLCEACNGETSCNAPDDCGASCGDGCCNGDENGCNCEKDCGGVKCGNGLCEPCKGEDACSCPGDCGGPDACGDGQCCGGESACGCGADCGGVVHGDALCCANEDVCDEAACGPVSGNDGLCCASEDPCSDLSCGPVTPGDGFCCAGETICTDAACGPSSCGDGCCGSNETPCACPADCGPPSGTPVCVTIVRGGAGGVADALLSGDAPGWATGTEQNLWTGESEGDHENRAIYRFDLSPVPAGAVVTSATFEIWLSYNPVSATISAHRILLPWSEATVSANTFAAAGSIDPAIVGSLQAAGSGYKAMDVKSVVSGWVSGATPNHGLVLTEPLTAEHHTFSSESSVGLRPKLQVCYVGCGQ